MVKPCRDRLCPHVFGRFLERQEYPDGGRLAVDGADELADEGATYLAALDLDYHPLGLAGVVIDESDNAIDALICAFLSLLARAIATMRPSSNEGERPPLELKAVILSQLSSAMNGRGFADDFE